MKTSNKVLLAVTSTLVSSQALAHSGHDHAANTSMLEHVVFYGGIAAVLAIGAFVAAKLVSNSNK